MATALNHIRAAQHAAGKKHTQRIIEALVDLLTKAKVPGKDLLAYMPDAPLEYARPALIAPSNRETLEVSPLMVFTPHMRGRDPGLFFSAWKKACNRLLTKSGPSKCTSLPDLSKFLGFPVGHAAMLFSPPIGDSYRDLVQFAAESVAVFEMVFGVSASVNNDNYYVEMDSCIIGVKNHQLCLPGLSTTIMCTPTELKASMILERGPISCYGTLDILDCMYIWADEAEDGEEIKSHLLYLRALNDPETLIAAQRAVLAADGATLVKRPRRRRSSRVTQMRVTKQVTYPEMLSDFQRVEEIIMDEAIPDISRVYDIADILVTKYMAEESFRSRFGIRLGSLRTSTLSEEQIVRFRTGWTEYSTATLDRAHKRDLRDRQIY